MKSFLACTAIGVVAFAPAVQAQQFYHVESPVSLKNTAPDWDQITLDPTRGYLFIGRRGDGITVFVRVRLPSKTVTESQ
jgi:hypothetical protein